MSVVPPDSGRRRPGGFLGRRLPTGRRGGPTAVATLATLATVVLLVGGALVAGSGAQTRRVELASGSAWIASPDRGYLTLIDGPSEQIVATVATPTAPALSVTPHGSDALVTDATAGTVTLVRGDTYISETPVQFGVGSSELSVVVGEETGFVIDAASRVATIIDPETLQVIGTPVTIAAQPGRGQTLLGPTGRLWVVDSRGTGLNWYDPDGTQGRASAGPGARLLAVGDSAAVIDLGQNQPAVDVLNSDGTTRPWSCRLGIRAGDDVELLTAPSGDAVYAVIGDTGTLVVAAEDERCGTVVPLGETGSDFGSLVQSDEFVFVPDRTTGAVVVVDTGTWSVVRLPLTAPSNDLELVDKDGIVFYNDRSSEKAGVLKRGSDRTWIAGIALRKYNPDTGDPEVPIISRDSNSVTPSAFPSGTNSGSEQTPTAESNPVNTTAEEPPEIPPLSSINPSAGTNRSTPTTSSSRTTTRSSTDVSSTTQISQATTTPQNATQASTSPPSMVPVILDIVSAGPLVTGTGVAFSASVKDADGQWTWTVASGEGAPVMTSHNNGSFSFTPEHGIATLVVTLTVGASEMAERTFAVAQAVVPTTLVLSIDQRSYWSDEMVYPEVVITGPAGAPAATGEVQLMINYPDQNPEPYLWGSATLADGRATFDPRSFTGSESDVTLTATYLGDEFHQSAEPAQALVSLEDPPNINAVYCYQDPQVGESFTVRAEFSLAFVNPDNVNVHLELNRGAEAGAFTADLTHVRDDDSDNNPATFEASIPQTDLPGLDAYFVTLAVRNSEKATLEFSGAFVNCN